MSKQKPTKKEPVRSTFAKKLWTLLDGRKQTWLAEMTGLSTYRVNRLCKRSIPRPEELRMFAQLFKTDVDYLCDPSVPDEPRRIAKGTAGADTGRKSKPSRSNKPPASNGGP